MFIHDTLTISTPNCSSSSLDFKETVENKNLDGLISLRDAVALTKLMASRWPLPLDDGLGVISIKNGLCLLSDSPVIEAQCTLVGNGSSNNM